MGVKDRAAKAAAGAVSIAVATSGLSDCSDNGAVDPPPPPLNCSAIGDGHTLQAEATVVGDDTVRVTVQHLGYWEWSVDSVRMDSGGSISAIVLPQGDGTGYGTMSLNISLESGSDAATFTVFAKATDLQKTCDIVRQFTVTATGAVASVAQLRLDGLPLPSRQPVTIMLLAHEGNTATLEARTTYEGAKTVNWSVSDGVLNAYAEHRATWTLPRQRGTYQAQVVVDFGEAGFAFDALALEVL